MDRLGPTPSVGCLEDTGRYGSVGVRSAHAGSRGDRRVFCSRVKTAPLAFASFQLEV